MILLKYDRQNEKLTNYGILVKYSKQVYYKSLK